MKRTIAITSCFGILCFAALGIWVYVKCREQGVAPVPEGKVSEGPLRNKLPPLDKLPDPTEKKVVTSVFALPMEIVSIGDNHFRPCYFDLERKGLYLWKGVVLKYEQVPEQYKGVISGIRMLNAKDFTDIVTVEALVKYREVDGEYRPGYLLQGVFYQWKGVKVKRDKVIARSQDGQNSVVGLDAVNQVIEIDIPAHMKEYPQLWRRP